MKVLPVYDGDGESVGDHVMIVRLLEFDLLMALW